MEWKKPGFELGLQLKQCLDENPGIRGIMLGSHGLFTWGDTAYESYLNTLEVIEICSDYLSQNYGKKVRFLVDKRLKVQQQISVKTSGCFSACFTWFVLFQTTDDRSFY